MSDPASVRPLALPDLSSKRPHFLAEQSAVQHHSAEEPWGG